jgi:hypothetical protein
MTRKVDFIRLLWLNLSDSILAFSRMATPKPKGWALELSNKTLVLRKKMSFLFKGRIKRIPIVGLNQKQSEE